MALQVGDIIPNFVALDTNGAVFESKNVLGIKPLVIYFYPKDNTSGCTIEACGFRDEYKKFTDLGAEVIGISSDSVESHQNFSRKHKLPFILLSDKDKKIRHLFGVSSVLFGLFPSRITYVVDKKGVIILIFDGLKASKHIYKALDTIKELAS